MITLRISSAAAVETRPVPWWCHPAMAQTATRTGEVMYQTGITAPSSRAPWVRPCRPLSPGRPSRIGVTKKATENSTPTITPTTTVVKTSSALSMTTPRQGARTPHRGDSHGLAEQQGWDAVTTRRLTERIEYSQPVLCSHFRDKRETIGVALEGAAEMAALLRAAARAADCPRARVTTLARTYLDFAECNAAVYDTMFQLDGGLAFANEDTPQPLNDAFAALLEGPRRGRRGRCPPGAVHRGVLGGTARAGHPDPGGTTAAGGHRVEDGAASGPARHGLTHRPGGRPAGVLGLRCLPAASASGHSRPHGAAADRQVPYPGGAPAPQAAVLIDHDPIRALAGPSSASITACPASQ